MCVFFRLMYIISCFNYYGLLFSFASQVKLLNIYIFTMQALYICLTNGMAMGSLELCARNGSGLTDGDRELHGNTCLLNIAIE